MSTRPPVYNITSLSPSTTMLTQGKSRLRLIHNVANGPVVDGFLDGKKFLKKFSYQAISGYIEISSGTHLITIKMINNEIILINGEIKLNPETDYTLIIHGKVTSLMPLLIEDDLACPVLGKAHIRFVNAAIMSSPVDVYMGTTRIYSDVAYGQIGHPEYLRITAGNYDFSLNASNIQKPMRFLGPIPLRFANGGIYTLITSGISENSNFPLTLLISEDSKGACIVLNL